MTEYILMYKEHCFLVKWKDKDVLQSILNLIYKYK